MRFGYLERGGVVVVRPDGPREPRKSSPEIDHPNAPARTRCLLR